MHRGDAMNILERLRIAAGYAFVALGIAISAFGAGYWAGACP